MAEKSKPGANEKKQGKTLQEKRSAKKAKKAEKSKRGSA
jgi:hypothetical protein